MTYQLPEPATATDWHHDGFGEPAYTRDQMIQAYTAGQRDMREAAALVADDGGAVGSTGEYGDWLQVPEAIRALPLETL